MLAKGVNIGFDANNYIAAAWHATQGNGNRTEASLFLEFVDKMTERINPVHQLCAFDGLRDLCFRRAIFPEYKAKKPPRPESLVYQLERAKELLTKRGIPWACFGEFEADDILATYASKSNAAGMKCIVTSTDKDLFQILSRGLVSLYRKLPGVGPQIEMDNVYTEDNLFRDHGITPSDWPKYLAIAGDSSDGWPGAKGVGPVGAKNFIAGKLSKRSQLSAISNLDFSLALKIVTLIRDLPIKIIEDKHEAVL